MFITSLLPGENPICLENTVVSSVSCEKLFFSVGCASKVLALKGRLNKSHAVCSILSALSNRAARASPNTNKQWILKPKCLWKGVNEEKSSWQYFLTYFQSLLYTKFGVSRRVGKGGGGKGSLTLVFFLPFFLPFQFVYSVHVPAQCGYSVSLFS